MDQKLNCMSNYLGLCLYPCAMEDPVIRAQIIEEDRVVCADNELGVSGITTGICLVPRQVPIENQKK